MIDNWQTGDARNRRACYNLESMSATKQEMPDIHLIADETERRGQLVLHTLPILGIPVVVAIIVFIVLRVTLGDVLQPLPSQRPLPFSPIVPIIVVSIFFSSLIMLVRMGRPTVSALLLIGTWTLFTTLAAMFIAADARHHVTLGLFLAVAVGGYMAAGAANAINMVIDRDIDGHMKRTAQRPTVTRRISSRDALRFAFTLELLSFAILWRAANLLTAMLALAGLVFYIIVYTLCLKRRTWHNIVIGGAAGAFPPLVGWAAVTDSLSLLAWYLFAIIFVWTPVHFWALALLLKDDYAEAGIPMLPVVLGERVTVVQISLYAVLTTVISVLPFVQRQVGPLYFVAALLLNAALLAQSFQLCRSPSRPRASSLFHYSMVYLALLFLIMAVDRVIRM